MRSLSLLKLRQKVGRKSVPATPPAQQTFLVVTWHKLDPEPLGGDLGRPKNCMGDFHLKRLRNTGIECIYLTYI